MKKIISAVAALGLVVGVAGTASAMDFSISGKYVLEGYMLGGAGGNGFGGATIGLDDEDNDILVGNGGGLYDDDASSDSAWVHTFIIKPQLKVNDKITMFSEIRLAKDADWGGHNNYKGDTGKSDSDLNWDNESGDNSSRTADIYHVYMEYMSPIGKIRAGRVPVGSWGSDFMSTASTGDRLMWWPSFMPEPFSLCLFTQKIQENEWYDDTVDSDSDAYEIDLGYKIDDMNLHVAYDFFNDKSKSGLADPYDAQYNLLKANAEMKFGNIAVVGELGWQFGDYRNYDSGDDVDQDAMAAMVDASMTMDKLNVGVMYFWAEGQDADDDDITAAMATIDDGIGDDFNPYYILTGDHTGMLNSDEYRADAGMAASGVHSLGVHADYQIDDQLTLHGAVAYAMADDTGYVESLANINNSVDEEYGWEIDLGTKYKLLDNLTYEIHAGYLIAGDYFEDISDDADDVYMLSHHLTMTF